MSGDARLIHELRAGDKITIEEDGEIKRGLVRGEAVRNSMNYAQRYLVDLPDEHVKAKFSTSTASPALQQLRWVTISVDDENKTWVRGWMDAEEMKALIVAEALA